MFEINQNKKKVLESEALVTRQKSLVRIWSPVNAPAGVQQKYFGDPDE